MSAAQPAPVSPGPIGRLGRWTADHFKAVAVAWVVVALGLGVLAPRVETALSGAGWEATGSESVKVRQTVDREFGGLSSSALMVVVHSPDRTVGDPAFDAVVTKAQRTLRADPRVTQVVAPRPGSRSPATGTRRSSRPGRVRARTTWSVPPTTSRRSCAGWRAAACRSP